MTNRAERRRRQPIETKMLNLKELTHVRCGWMACMATIPTPEGEAPFPAGWRTLVVSEKSLHTLAGLMEADHDKMLCPKHVRELDRLLEGSARVL